MATSNVGPGNTVRAHCGVCGEAGNHGDVPHSVAVASRFRDERKEFVAWLEKQADDLNEAFPVDATLIRNLAHVFEEEKNIAD